MVNKPLIRPVGPPGELLTVQAPPSPETRRWTPRRKARSLPRFAQGCSRLNKLVFVMSSTAKSSSAGSEAFNVAERLACGSRVCGEYATCRS